MANNESFFQRLTRIFRSGPAVRRRIKGYDYNAFYDKKVLQNNLGYTGPLPFKREASQFSVLGAYGILDRMARFAEFAEMDSSTPIISKALDVYADEAFSGDENGRCFHIYSSNPEIKRALEELFYDVMNIEFNGRTYIRNVVKYGDCFLYHEVLPDYGVVNVQPVAVNELEREEGYDPQDPYAIRYKWLNKGQKYLENWQITHFRIIGNDLFLPYGTSLLESARRPWRQYLMMLDAMMVYRLIRSPERRVYYIDVGNIAPNDIPGYMEAAKEALRGSAITNATSGRMDIRYNPVSVDEDIFIPLRGTNTATKVENLPGGQHVTATEDIELIQSQLFTAVGVPKPYLGFDEALSSKATLSAEDIRFSRTITILQKLLISELNNLAILHLYAKGFDGQDLIDFELKLSNPSSMALQQKLDIWRSKFSIIGDIGQMEIKPVDMEWMQKELLGLSDEEITRIKLKLLEDARFAKKLESIVVEDDEPATTDPFDPSNYQLPGGNPIVPTDHNKSESEEEKTENGFVPPSGQEIAKDSSSNPPIKANPTVQARKTWKRKGTSAEIAARVPGFNKMLNPSTNKSLKDVGDMDFLRNPLYEKFEKEIKQGYGTKMVPGHVKRMIEGFNKKYRKPTSVSDGLLIELKEEEDQNNQVSANHKEIDDEVRDVLLVTEGDEDMVTSETLEELGVSLKTDK